MAATHHIHNLYTLRGAQVRNALVWSKYIDETIDLFGKQAELAFASHHWPMWGNERIVDYLKKQRDTYKFIHDQTLRLANQGKTSREIAEEVALPESLRTSFPNRGYYGTVRHNAKAVYQGYFGWYDGNPANLDPLPPVEEGRRYVAAMGGADAVLAEAERAFEAGEYRWAATLLDHLVFAEPGNVEARALLARVYDQLGYRAESGPWRDEYLTGAYELRHGRPDMKPVMAGAAGLLARTPTARFLEALATRVDGPAAEGREFTLNLVLTDVVMPRMNGRELAARLRVVRPDLEVLFMSGYAGHPVSDSLFLDPALSLLQKPFTLDQLCRTVRERLDTRA